MCFYHALCVNMLLLFIVHSTSRPLYQNSLSCSHASSLALFPIESLPKIAFQERTATGSGPFIFKQSTGEKHISSGYRPSLKNQTLPQFLDDFSGPFNVVQLLLQYLFFFLFFKFCLGHRMNVTLAGSSSEKNNFLYIYA